MTYGNRPYSPDLKQRLISARLAQLESLVQRAGEEAADVFLVAGDMFHRTNIRQDFVIKAAQMVSQFQGQCVIILPGNHDHLESYNSIWETFMPEAADHVILLDQQAPYDLQDFGLDAAVYPAPCDQKHASEHNLGWIMECRDRPPRTWHLGVAHGSVAGISPDFQDQYFPMKGSDLENTNLDHWFLGHTHVPYPDYNISSTRQLFTFCGTPEPDGFDCRHGGYARITEIDDQKGVSSRLITTGQYRFIEFTKDITSLEDVYQVEGDVSSEVKAEKNRLVKLTLEGSLDRDEYDKLPDALETLEAHFEYLEEDISAVQIAITPEEIKREFPDNSIPALLLNRLAERDQQALQLAYQMIRKVKRL